MSKRLLLSTLLILSCCNALAANTLYYGIAFISQDLTHEITQTTGGSTTIEHSGSGLGLYVDLFYQDQYRLNTTLSHISYTGFTFTSLTASADYLFPINSNFTFFTGVTAGSAAMIFDVSSTSDAALGTLFGVQAGAIIVLPANIILELGYRIRPAKVETEIVDGSGNVTATSTVDELNESYVNLIISF